MATGVESKGEGHKRLYRRLDNGSDYALAISAQPGAKGPQLVWFNGFKSDMGGTKALALQQWAKAEGRPLLRFDYMGHGASGGAFIDGTISIWRDDGLCVIDQETTGDLLLIGSSMGAWIATLCALARPQRVKAMVLIAPALDFTELLMWQNFDGPARRAIMEKGFWARPSLYSPDPYPITRQLIEDGRQHLLLDAPIDFGRPVSILQGMRDPDVPHAHALLCARQFSKSGVAMTLIADGDHRLSRPDDIARLLEMVEAMCQLV